MKTINSKKGITLMELMVVIAIMGVLSTVAMPKMFGASERAREKIDLMKLYDLRNAINLALIEDMDAMTSYEPSKAQSDDEKQKSLNKLAEGLKSDRGATLFVIEVHNGLSVNVQGSHRNANNTNNICEMVGLDGTFYRALKEANFYGVADIIAARLNGNDWKSDGETYTSKEYTNSYNKTDYRTAPKKALFQSRALNAGKADTNTRYTVSLHWADGSQGYSVEVYLNPNGGSYYNAYKTDNGTCFSTFGNKGCSNKKWK